MGRKLILLLSRVVLSGLFAWAAVLKLRAPDTAHIAIYQYRILDWEEAGVLAAFLPWLELAVASGLWIKRIRIGAATAGIALNLTFIAALASALVRKLDITCGCFGSLDVSTALAPRLIQDVFLLAACVFLLKENLIQRGLISGKVHPPGKTP